MTNQLCLLAEQGFYPWFLRLHLFTMCVAVYASVLCVCKKVHAEMCTQRPGSTCNKEMLKHSGVFSMKPTLAITNELS